MLVSYMLESGSMSSLCVNCKEPCETGNMCEACVYGCLQEDASGEEDAMELCSQPSAGVPSSPPPTPMSVGGQSQSQSCEPATTESPQRRHAARERLPEETLRGILGLAFMEPWTLCWQLSRQWRRRFGCSPAHWLLWPPATVLALLAKRDVHTGLLSMCGSGPGAGAGAAAAAATGAGAAAAATASSIQRRLARAGEIVALFEQGNGAATFAVRAQDLLQTIPATCRTTPAHGVAALLLACRGGEQAVATIAAMRRGAEIRARQLARVQAHDETWASNAADAIAATTSSNIASVICTLLAAIKPCTVGFFGTRALLERAHAALLQFPAPRVVKPTTEQGALLSYEIRERELVLVEAFAGAAKTTTLEHICRRNLGLNFLYVCFNKRAAEDARRRVPANVECRTINSLAYSCAKLAHSSEVPHKVVVGSGLRIQKPMGSSSLSREDFERWEALGRAGAPGQPGHHRLVLKWAHRVIAKGHSGFLTSDDFLPCRSHLWQKKAKREHGKTIEREAKLSQKPEFLELQGLGNYPAFEEAVLNVACSVFLRFLDAATCGSPRQEITSHDVYVKIAQLVSRADLAASRDELWRICEGGNQDASADGGDGDAGGGGGSGLWGGQLGALFRMLWRGAPEALEQLLLRPDRRAQQYSNAAVSTRARTWVIDPIVQQVTQLGYLPDRIVLLDEFQDFSAVNYSLLVECLPDLRHVAVGDSHQQIYDFRGACGAFARARKQGVLDDARVAIEQFAATGAAGECRRLAQSLNSYQRLRAHTLAQSLGLQTHSEGAGRWRRIVMRHAGVRHEPAQGIESGALAVRLQSEFRLSTTFRFGLGIACYVHGLLSVCTNEQHRFKGTGNSGRVMQWPPMLGAASKWHRDLFYDGSGACVPDTPTAAEWDVGFVALEPLPAPQPGAPETRAPRACVCRTNAGVLMAAITFALNGFAICAKTLGGSSVNSQLKKMIEGSYKLFDLSVVSGEGLIDERQQAAGIIREYFPRKMRTLFQTWGELEAHVEMLCNEEDSDDDADSIDHTELTGEQKQLIRACQLVQQLRERTGDALEALNCAMRNDNRSVHIEILTVHTAKGSQWDEVWMWSDFANLVSVDARAQLTGLERLKASRFGDRSNEGFNCIYVAATRARKRLIINEGLARLFHIVFGQLGEHPNRVAFVRAMAVSWVWGALAGEQVPHSREHCHKIVQAIDHEMVANEVMRWLAGLPPLQPFVFDVDATVADYIEAANTLDPAPLSHTAHRRNLLTNAFRARVLMPYLKRTTTVRAAHDGLMEFPLDAPPGPFSVRDMWQLLTGQSEQT